MGAAAGAKWGYSDKGMIASMVIGGTMSELTGDKFANGAATAAFSYAMTWAAQKYGPGGNTENFGERGNPKNIDEDYFKKNPDLTVTKKTIDGETHIYVEGSYNTENMTAEQAQLIEANIEKGFPLKIKDAGTLYVDLRYDPSAEKAITFKMVSKGYCGIGAFCASVGGKYLYIPENNIQMAFHDRWVMKHEFGHILGFKHAHNGKYDIMSYDNFSSFQKRHFDVLNKNY